MQQCWRFYCDACKLYSGYGAVMDVFFKSVDSLTVFFNYACTVAGNVVHNNYIIIYTEHFRSLPMSLKQVSEYSTYPYRMYRVRFQSTQYSCL